MRLSSYLAVIQMLDHSDLAGEWMTGLTGSYRNKVMLTVGPHSPPVYSDWKRVALHLPGALRHSAHGVPQRLRFGPSAETREHPGMCDAAIARCLTALGSRGFASAHRCCELVFSSLLTSEIIAVSRA